MVYAPDRLMTPEAKKLARRWVAACSLGEAVGLTLSGTVGALTPEFVGNAPSPTTMSLIMVVAGALEGLAVGLVQYFILRHHVRLDWIRWVPLTSAGFAVGWAAGGLLSFIEPDVAIGIAALVGVAVASGAALGAVLGLFQAIAWSSTVSRPALWIPVTSLAWIFGMLVSVVGANELQTGPYVWTNVSLGLVTGAAVGAVVGVVTALPFVRLAES